MRKNYLNSSLIAVAILLVYCLFNFPFNAQAAMPPIKIQVKGVVTDAGSGAPVSYATISVQSIKGVIKRMPSGADGKFDFLLDSIGKCSLIVQAIGYETIKKDFVIDNKNTKVDLGTLKMKLKPEKLSEVTVMAEKPLVRTEVDKIVYSIETDPESKTSTALEMLRKVPLVTVDGEDNIQVKGSSSFKVLLNGKSSSMLTQNAKDVLRSLPASTIKDIEVITNPSSKYEAEGTGGIINIITTKKQVDGFMGRINTGVDTKGGYNGGLYMASKKKKFGFSLNYNYNRFIQPKNESFTTGANLLSTTDRYTESEGKVNYKGNFNSIMGEASYEIDSLNLVSLSFWGYDSYYKMNGDNLTQDFDINNNLTRKFNNLLNTTGTGGNFSGNIDYQRSYKKPDKTFTISYKLDRIPRTSDNGNEIVGIVNYPSYKQRSGNDAKGEEHTFQLDYYDPLTKKHQIESGVKYILRINTSESDVSRYDDNSQEWIRDNSRNNNLDYDQHIIGAYAGYVLKLKQFSLKTGLRAEATINDGTFKSTTDTSFTNKMFNLVPYITLSQNLKKGQNVKLSYTQRLSRPSIYYLNPYVNDVDPLNISYGNPNLDAEVSHTFDFSYGKFSQKYSVNISTNAAFTNNTIQQISTMNSSGVKTTTYKNIGKNQRFGTYIYGLWRPNKKTNFNVNLSANYSVLESNDDRNLKNEGLNYSIYSNLRYTIWKNGNLSGYGGYFSPRIMLQGKSGKYWYSGVSLSQEMFKKKLTASVSVNQPFTRRFRYESNQDDPTFTRRSISYSYQRMARFNLSWRFGQMKDQIKKAKRSIKNEDLKAGEESSSGGSSTQTN